MADARGGVASALRRRAAWACRCGGTGVYSATATCPEHVGGCQCRCVEERACTSPTCAAWRALSPAQVRAMDFAAGLDGEDLSVLDEALRLYAASPRVGGRRHLLAGKLAEGLRAVLGVE